MPDPCMYPKASKGDPRIQGITAREAEAVTVWIGVPSSSCSAPLAFFLSPTPLFTPVPAGIVIPSVSPSPPPCSVTLTSCSKVWGTAGAKTRQRPDLKGVAANALTGFRLPRLHFFFHAENYLLKLEHTCPCIFEVKYTSLYPSCLSKWPNPKQSHSWHHALEEEVLAYFVINSLGWLNTKH